MKRRRHSPEQVIRKLREADRMLSEGKSTAEVAKALEISEPTYNRWRNQYGGMKADDAKRLPVSFTWPDLEAVGFVGWRTWDDLRAGALTDVPGDAGVYLVYRTSRRRPSFLAVGTGGRFKSRDPNVPIETLQAKWVPGAQVLDIGKGDVLSGRLTLYERFGAGRPVAHWGGRYIWQIPAAHNLLVAWRPLGGPGRARDDEIRLLDHFRALHDGRLPFANLTG